MINRVKALGEAAEFSTVASAITDVRAKTQDALECQVHDNIIKTLTWNEKVLEVSATARYLAQAFTPWEWLGDIQEAKDLLNEGKGVLFRDPEDGGLRLDVLRWCGRPRINAYRDEVGVYLQWSMPGASWLRWIHQAQHTFCVNNVRLSKVRRERVKMTPQRRAIGEAAQLQLARELMGCEGRRSIETCKPLDTLEQIDHEFNFL